MKLEINKIPAVLPDGNSVTVKTVTVFVDGGKIAGIDSKPDGFIADRTFTGNCGKLLIPGLINTHTHSYMSLFRNHADDLPFEDWLFKRILPLEDKLTSEDAYWGALLSCAEMIKTGTTCFSDMHMFKHQILKAVNKSGMRAVLSRGLVGSFANNVLDDGSRIQDALEDISLYQTRFNDGLVTFFLAPHAVYTCDAGYLRYVAGAAKEHDLGIHIHVSETEREVSDCISKFGMTPVAFLDSLGIFDIHTAAAHCVYLTDSDINILSEKKVNALTNPISNMKLGNGFAPIPELLSKGINVSLGTDSAASNNSLNMFRELSFLTLIHKGDAKDPTKISAKEGFLIATKNGAKSLKLAGSTGSVAVGFNADLAVLNLDTPNFYPRNDILAGLSYSATGSEVETVIIGGKIVMENRELKTIDEERLYYEISRIADRIYR